ncbi:MAG: penicillin acylase family protein, partial [Myxococcota bacterium]
SVAYTGYSSTRELEAFRRINLARGLNDFRAAIEFFDVGSQNFVYADRGGNIAYFTTAELPLREDLEAGTVTGLPPWFIRNGTGGNDWIAETPTDPTQAIPYRKLPSREMPQIVNPRRGFVVNANNDPLGLTIDNDPLNTLRPTGGILYLSAGYAAGLRAKRITDRLEQKLRHQRVDFHDMQAIQADVRLIDAEFFIPYIRRAFRRARAGGAPAELTALVEQSRIRQAVRRLKRWDLSAPTGIAEGFDDSDVSGYLFEPSRREIRNSVAATIYSVWRGQFVRRVIDDTLDELAAAAGLPSLPSPSSSLAIAAVRNLLENFDARGGVGVSGVDFFAVPAVPNAQDRLAIVILQSLADALDRLAGEPFAPAFGGSTRQRDYRWGRLHRVVLSNPLGDPFNLPSTLAGFPPPLDDLPGYPVDGGFNTVDASTHSARAQSFDDFMFVSGPVVRYVGELGRFGVRSESSLPGGPSGVVGSPLYGNLLTRWLTNESYPVRTRRYQVAFGAIERIRLRPR